MTNSTLESQRGTPMTVNEKLLNRSVQYLNQKIEEEKLKLLLILDQVTDEDELIDLEKIQLKRIYPSIKQVMDSNKIFTTFVHEFDIGMDKLLRLDVLESDAQAKEIAPTDDYSLFYTSFDGGDIHRDFNVSSYGLCEILDEIEYQEFFLEDYELLDECINGFKESEEISLFNSVKDSYPGLERITYSFENDDYYMIFSTGAELLVSKRNILMGHEKASKKI